MLIRTIYISGKITGLPVEETQTKFAAAAGYWAENGCHAINPMQVVKNPHAKWEQAMHKCLMALLDCQAIYILPDWLTSRGARLEITIAHALGLDLILSDLRQQKLLNQYLMKPECQCITAAAKYRCRHANGYDHCDLETETNSNYEKKEPSKTIYMDKQTGLPKKLFNADSNVLLGEKAFKEAWADFEKELENKAKKFNGFPQIIETHYGNPEHYQLSFLGRLWIKISIFLLVVVSLPWIMWQLIRNPEAGAKLPFVD